MTGDEFDGGTTWGVRWGERGTPLHCREYGDEEQATAMYRHLVKRYEQLGRTDSRPELIRARIVWRVVDAVGVTGEAEK